MFNDNDYFLLFILHLNGRPNCSVGGWQLPINFLVIIFNKRNVGVLDIVQFQQNNELLDYSRLSFVWFLQWWIDHVKLCNLALWNILLWKFNFHSLFMKAVVLSQCVIIQVSFCVIYFHECHSLICLVIFDPYLMPKPLNVLIYNVSHYYFFLNQHITH